MEWIKYLIMKKIFLTKSNINISKKLGISSLKNFSKNSNNNTSNLNVSKLNYSNVFKDKEAAEEKIYIDKEESKFINSYFLCFFIFFWYFFNIFLIFFNIFIEKILEKLVKKMSEPNANSFIIKDNKEEEDKLLLEVKN